MEVDLKGTVYYLDFDEARHGGVREDGPSEGSSQEHETRLGRIRQGTARELREARESRQSQQPRQSHDRRIREGGAREVQAGPGEVITGEAGPVKAIPLEAGGRENSLRKATDETTGAGPRTVYVHGLGGSHINWIGLAPLLSPHVRGMAVDLPGFGLTPANGRSTTVGANAQVLKQFLREVVGEQVMLVGNSMGGLISMIVAAEAPELVSSLVLINPVLPLARGVRVDPAVGKQFLFNGVPFLGEWVLSRRYSKVPARQRVSEVLARCCLDAERVPLEMVERLIELEESLTEQADHASCQLEAARSIVRGLAWTPTYWRRMASIEHPVLLLHGKHDRLVPIASAHQAAKRFPHWTFVELDAGHIPQMEVPHLVAEEIVKWLNRSA